MSEQPSHLMTIDNDGDGWTVDCSCGWHGWSEREVWAMNLFAEHEEEIKEKS